MQQLKGRVRQYAVTNGTKVAQQRKLRNSGLDVLLEEGQALLQKTGAEAMWMDGEGALCYSAGFQAFLTP